MPSNWTERKVVITGLGVVSPLGNDLDTFWSGLISGKCGVGKITAFDASQYDTQIAAEVKNFDPTRPFLRLKKSGALTGSRNMACMRAGRHYVIQGWTWTRRTLMNAGYSSVLELAACRPPPSSTRSCSSAAQGGCRRS